MLYFVMHDNVKLTPTLPLCSVQTVGVEPHCVVSFDFDPQGDDEISLKMGEKVTLLERIGDDWFRGKIGTREGIFPNTFVDVIIDLPSAGATPSTAKARYDFAADDADELSFKVSEVEGVNKLECLLLFRTSISINHHKCSVWNFTGTHFLGMRSSYCFACLLCLNTQKAKIKALNTNLNDLDITLVIIVWSRKLLSGLIF